MEPSEGSKPPARIRAGASPAAPHAPEEKGLIRAATMADTWAAIVELEGRRMLKKGRGAQGFNACQIASAFRTFAKTLRRQAASPEVPSLTLLRGGKTTGMKEKR